jgi:hypothetical protein
MADDLNAKQAQLTPERAGIDQAVWAELEDIVQRRRTSGVDTASLDDAALAALNGEKAPALGARNDHHEKPWIRNCHRLKLFGICISGGGIRSATFGLGILQGLAEKGLLSKADYISTVSGGGYIGAWLQGLADRNPEYNEVLQPERTPDIARKDPITFLRKYSNYLAPRNGLSLDALVIPLIWFRNFALNQSIIIAALMALYIALLGPGALLRRIATDDLPYSVVVLMAVLMIGTALITVVNIGPNLRRIVEREFGKSAGTILAKQKKEEQANPQGRAQVVNTARAPAEGGKQPPDGPALAKKKREQKIGTWIVFPLFIAVLALIFLLASKQPLLVMVPEPWRAPAGIAIGFVLLFTLVALLQVRGGFIDCYIKQRETIGEPVHPGLPWWHVLWMSLVTTIFLLLWIVLIWRLTTDWEPATAYGSQMVIAWAPSLYFLAIIVSIGLQIGLMGRDFPDASREWLVRLAGLLLTFLAIWAGFFALAVFAPLGVAKLWLHGKTWLASGTGAWLMTTVLSVFAGKSGKSGSLEGSPQQKKQSTTVDLLARYGPFIAITGFLAAVAFATQALLHPIPWNARGTFLENFADNYWDRLPFGNWGFPLILLGFLVLTCAVLSWRVNINEFSMHHFYKNRLVRCYLGASAAKKRKADPFTGFDAKDDIPLFKLRHKAENTHRVPYPIANAALTVTAGTELATQERKALPWFFTPHYSGFYPARSDNDNSGDKNSDSDSIASKLPASYADSKVLGKGIALGTATGISGAAANPNSGFHSSPQTAFLLTLFNVRLGWWLGNPTNEKAVKRSGPLFALLWLGRELLGFADERSFFLNLSDGGHFENLGLYELVRRRCRYIIAIDGEEDKDYRFESLGGAVRKCRTDFGVEIEIDPRPITPQDKFSRTHCVVGRIYYPKNENAEPGFLLYMKSSITGDEPADVEEYRRENPEFPQQPTLDQFFSESQFESYRRLGVHVARTTLDHTWRWEPTRPAESIQPMNPTKPMDPTKPMAPTNAPKTIEQYLQGVFERLNSQWLLPPEVAEGVYTRHGEAYKDMLKTLAGTDSSEPEGKAADGAGKMPEWIAEWDKAVIDPKKVPDWAKNSEEGRRRFYFYLQLLQLIEDVFVDLDFGNAYKWNHPATTGWRTVITYWAQQQEMKAVWDLQKENYGEPFNSCFNDLVNRIDPVPGEQRR